jgi:hypothetical protein
MTVVACEAVDGANNKGTASFNVTVRDTTAPTITVPADMKLEATSKNGAVGIFAASAVDIVSGNIAPLCTPASGSTFPLGTTTVTCTAKDGAGNGASKSFKFTVQDATPPDIRGVTPSQQSLWPPNHKMVSLTLSVVVNDRVDAAPVCRISSIVSNEPTNGTGDGDTAPDWVIGSGLSFQLRAERAGTGPGRVYTITVECHDSSSNRATKWTTVSVPKSQ